ncbi:hypothetical protein KTAU_24100 [Thermogemmatispora aurantia]|uniref:Uncharacterized protein n=1 Tax=Thermogemmatispora aurantia TaxID=2045279 RepID=A0A5J4K854_9CHLR|nr:sigma factor [Thermogemmatispora aurantia]GER83773.1 hypothetical protein KTAU_24100 [Thermogemmatispora aurantia]
MGLPVSPPSTQELEAVYQRLLAQDPTAPDDFAELVLDPLTAQLRLRYASVPDPQLIQDAVTDSVLTFLEHPKRYRPERGSLWHYLMMNAEGDLRNALSRYQREQQRQLPLSSVALPLSAGNSSLEEVRPWQEAEARLALSAPPLQELLQRLRSETFTPIEWRIVVLMLQGERRTSAYAAELGLTYLSIEEQRKQVKRVKDRLRSRLKRHGVRFDEK